MNAETWRQIKQLFEDLEILPPGDRERLLADAAWGDSETRATLRALFDNLEHNPGILDGCAIDLVQTDRSLLFSSATRISGQTDPPVAKIGDDHYFQLDSDRFQVLRKVGGGGMGSVYEALDRVMGAKVALKRLDRATSATVYLFKREFRSLAHVNHRNLVALYDFFSDRGTWFYTMEFIHGSDFVSYALLTGDGVPGQRIGRIRSAMSELAEGISALHAIGKLHRDIKPGNVIVADDSRVVLVDFGLVVDVAIRSSGVASFAGTANYMSPEQIRGDVLTPASDWYSAGVMLYEALTGRRPPPAATRLLDGQPVPVSQPSSIAEVPEDLSLLCVEMLALEARNRPSGGEIANRLGMVHRPRAARLRIYDSRLRLLIGRGEELDFLRGAFEQFLAGTRTAVCVEGDPGIGKSTLIETFLNELAELPDRIILKGKCFERESVPFNALDSLIDALGEYLKRLSSPELESLLPADVEPLCEMFPVMRWLRPDWRRALLGMDRQQPYRRAVACVRELLDRIGRRSPLVLFIDDLQWGDADSAAMLADLVRGDGAPRMLLVIAYRTEDRLRSHCLRSLLDLDAGAPLANAGVFRLGPLPAESAQTLAEALLGGGAAGESSTVLAQSISRESGGNPYFLRELAAYSGQSGLDATQSLTGTGVTLSSIISARAERLPESARCLLEIIVVAGQPIRNVDALNAAALDQNGVAAIALLRNDEFVRAAAPSRQESLEPFHGRLRETILGTLAPERRRSCHASLAATLEKAGSAEPEVLGTHFEGAGEMRRAASYYLQGGEQAYGTLAFHKAADLFGRALAAGEFEGPVWLRVVRRRAEAQANAGQAYEAARTYEEAADERSQEGLVSLSNSGYYYAASGHIEQGKKAFSTVLARLRIRVPLDARYALISLLVIRLLLVLRRFRFEVRDPAGRNPEELARVDVCWFIGTALGLVELMSGAAFTSYSLHLALKSGDRARIARGLTWEAAIAASQNKKGKRRSEELFAICRPIVAELKEPYTSGMLALTEGQSFFSHGRWRDALAKFSRAEELFRQSTGVSFELATLHGFRLQTLVYLGDYVSLRSRSSDLLEAAQSAGDLYLETFITGAIQPLLFLADDDPDRARAWIAKALDRWSAPGYHLQHALIDQVQLSIELYCGRGEEAEALIGRRWRLLKRSGLLFNQNLRAKLLEVRTRCCLAAGSLDSAATFLKGLEQEKEPYLRGSELSLRAVLANRNGDGASAILERAIQALDTWEMSDHRSSAAYVLTRWVGAENNRDLHNRAIDWLSGQKIQNPERWVRMRLPGASDS